MMNATLLLTNLPASNTDADAVPTPQKQGTEYRAREAEKAVLNIDEEDQEDEQAATSPKRKRGAGA